jgi:uncharacterized protein YqkB
MSCFIVALAACGTSTQIVDSWRDPDVVVDTAKIHRFVVAALLKNQTIRRQVEDDMAARFPDKAVQSYKELGEDELKEDDAMYNQKLKSDGYDGIVMMRLVDVDKSTRYVPGTNPVYYSSWRRYWRYSWTGFYDPVYYTTDKAYNVEVTVYSLLRDKLVWAANTTTVNPSGRGELFAEVSNAVVKKMKKEGFLK